MINHTKTIASHILGITLFILSEQVYLQMLGAHSPYILLILFYTFDIIFFYLLICNMLPDIRDKNKLSYRQYIAIPITIIFYAAVLCFTGLAYISILAQKNLFTHISRQNIFLCLWRSTYVFAISMIYHLIVERFRQIKEENILLKERSDAMRTKNELEIALLKSQLNPHLLFNGFNFIYKQLIVKDPGTAKTVLLLSEMADYSLSDKRQTDLVTLDEDIENIKRYIQFHQELNNDQLQINFTDELQEATKSVVLPPLLFLNFVENVFKHGSFDVEAEPAMIAFYRVGNNLVFKTSNQILQIQNKRSKGIGLSNTSQRLNHYFPNNYQLKTQSVNKTYHLFLSIKLWNSAATW